MDDQKRRVDDDYIPSYAKPRNSKPKVLAVSSDKKPPSPIGHAKENQDKKS